MQFYRYFVDSTLLDYQLISLTKLNFAPWSAQLVAGSDITVKLVTRNGSVHSFGACHIDNTSNNRLRLPHEIRSWLRQNYAFSAAYFASHPNESKIGIWKKDDIKTFDNAINKKIDKNTGKPVKMDVPGETILIAWQEEEGGYLLIRDGFRITLDNVTEYLSEKAIASVLPYILSSAQNISVSHERNDGKKCYLIDRTTNWLSASQYSATAFSHPGLYLLRRKTANGEYAYYIGKAVDIKNRIIQNDEKVTHPNEKEINRKQYDEIACIAVKFDDFIKLYGELTDENITPRNNPGVKMGSDADNALYAVEDIAIHVAAMLLLSEGKRLDNEQYRSYTSDWLKTI